MTEMLEQAVYLVRNGYTIVDAARLMSLPDKRLNDRVNYDTVRSRLAGQGINVGELNIAYSALVRLSGLRDAHLKEVALLSHAARLPTDRIHQLTREVREAQSDVEAGAIVERWRQEHGEDIQRSRSGLVRDPASPLRRLSAVVRQVEKAIAQHGTAEKVVSLRPREVDRMIREFRALIKNLEDMIARLQEVRTHVG